MWQNKLLVVIACLSLAALACSLAAPENDSGQSQAEPTTIAEVMASPVARETEPPPTATSSPVPTVREDTDTIAVASDPGSLDVVSGADSSGQASGGGAAVAVESLSSIQNVEAQLYLPNCTPVLNWPLYVVAGGDTLHKIATRHGTTWQSLAKSNCLANPNLIYVGQALHVPPAPLPPPDNNLPVIANPAFPSPPGCNVFVKDMSRLVPVYAGPGTVFGKVAYLYNYARWLESNLDGYRIEFPFGGSGWVRQEETYVAGDCGFELPEYNSPGNPPLNSCSAVPSAGSGWIARIYTAPGGQGDVIGRLGNYAPVLKYASGSYQITLEHWGTVGWVRETDIGLVGTCPNFHQPTPTVTAAPPSPTWTPVPPTATATPDDPFSDLPRISNPGRPAPDECVVQVNDETPALIYPGPISTGPIAVLENYAPYVESVEGGYEIALSESRRGWVSATDTDLFGQCFSTSISEAE